MADFTRRERTETFVEWLLPLGTCNGEMSKAYDAAAAEIKAANGGRWADDLFTVHADDEHLILRWRKS